MNKGIIQVAGIKNLNEAEMLLNRDIDQIGIPLRLPHGGEDVADRDARRIISKTGQSDRFVLITYLRDPDKILELCDYLNVNIVQLHADIQPAALQDIKQKDSSLEIIKSLIVKGGNLKELEEQVNRTFQLVDWYITDTFDPESNRIGATGKTHDWEISKNIVKVSPKPVILAGGLNCENVKEAILQVKPAGVDAHTGLEDQLGNKIAGQVRKFVREAHSAFARTGSQAKAIPINGVLDLHTFNPGDVKQLVPDYIQECIKNNISEIRIVHGKGKGVLKRIVRSILARHSAVIKFEDAREHGGNWGATVAKLKIKKTENNEGRNA